MHKYYDPRLFHMMKEDEILQEYAPKEIDGVLISAEEAKMQAPDEKRAAVERLTLPEHFIAAGFDVNFVGPEEEMLPKATASGDGHASQRSGAVEAGGCGASDLDDDDNDDDGDDDDEADDDEDEVGSAACRDRG